VVPASIIPLDVQRAPRRVIAIDESKIKIKGRWRYLWAAIDVDTWEVLAVRITKGRSGLDAKMFLREVLSEEVQGATESGC